jgi:VanZ family protein
LRAVSSLRSNCYGPPPNHLDEEANRAVTINDPPSLAGTACIPWVKAWHLAAVYALMIAYASLMPFDFSADWGRVAECFTNAWQYWPTGAVWPGRRDIATNVVAYIPLGFLVAVHWMLKQRTSRGGAAAAGALSAAMSIAMECLQLFLPSRTSQVSDVLANAAGGVIGGLLGGLLSCATWDRMGHRFQRWQTGRPTAILTILLALLLVAGALCPFYPVLEFSALKQNLLASHFEPRSGLALHPWHHWLVCRIGVYAVLAALLGASGMPRTRTRWLWGALLTTGFATAIEAAKPFIEDREANVANVLAAATGATAGAVLGAMLAGRMTRRAQTVLAAALLLIYIGYLEWQPFVFEWSPARAQADIPQGPAWLPLSLFALGKRRPEDVLKFLRTSISVAALIYVASRGIKWMRVGSLMKRAIKAAALASLLGLVFELVQVLIPDRAPTTTDLLTFAVGGAVGAWAYILAPPPVDTPGPPRLIGRRSRGTHPAQLGLPHPDGLERPPSRSL